MDYSLNSRPLERVCNFAYSVEALRICCAQARTAANCGRYSAAHDLLQTAAALFDQARSVVWDDSEEPYIWQHAWRLSQARTELDTCAAFIDTSQMITTRRASPATNGDRAL